MYSEATEKMSEFLRNLDEDQYEHMTLNTNVMPPVLVYDNKEEEVFFVLDPAGHRFFVDKGLLFEVPMDFETDTAIQMNVDKAGKSVMDTARNAAVQEWVKKMNL